MKIFGDANEKYLKKLQPIVDEVNKLEPKFEKFSDEELKKHKPEKLEEAFAMVREVAKRTIKQRHYDVQIMAGIALDRGEIAEMKTGEGKTLASTMPIYWNALNKKGVHIVTVNDYLAKRDTNWMGPIYNALGLSVGCITQDKSYIFNPHSKPDDEETSIEYENLKEINRADAYKADITYGTNNQFGFDYLRDNMAQNPLQKAQRELNYAIIDEIDSILIDEARTPLIISAPDEESSQLYQAFSRIVPKLGKDDCEVDRKSRSVTLTDDGMEKVQKLIGIDIYKTNSIKYIHHLEQALRARAIFKKDTDYVVKDGAVIIVDQFTGRMMSGRRFSGGLHQALEAKENVAVQQESRTLATITFQNYFRLYKKLAGMTGTALTSAEEFAKVYGLDVVAVPTNKSLIRDDKSDQIFKSENGKFKAVVREIKERNSQGQPVLIGTISIDKNEKLSKLLKKASIKHQVLNAKQHEQEANVIAGAGEKGAVTVATNMAGRGVDIKLGEEVKKLGGLHILGTERHESRRIDNQLRGRSGRQGDPGSSQFFVSLEDDLMRAFAPERVKGMMDKLKISDDQPIEHKLISKSIEEAQKRLEGYYFDIRKHVLEYDDVLNKQREKIYNKRREAFKIKDDLKKSVTLRVIDLLWMEHLDAMDYLRQSVNLRAYGQRDPLLEYKKEAHEMFKHLEDGIDKNIEHMLKQVKQTQEQQKFSGIGRNDPCPCGSKKKYKKCHLDKK